MRSFITASSKIASCKNGGCYAWDNFKSPESEEDSVKNKRKSMFFTRVFVMLRRGGLK